MFTGIVEETGVVERIETTATGIRLSLRAGRLRAGAQTQ